MGKPTVFIGCSREGLRIANEVQGHLQDCCEPTIWKDGVFGLGDGLLEGLVRATQKFDFAILILTPDDVAVVRKVEKNLPRDNVLFELGLFMGALGRERAIILHSDSQAPDLPADLAGVTVATFSANREDDNLSAALVPACHRICKRIVELRIHARSSFRDALTSIAWTDLNRSVQAGLDVPHEAFTAQVRGKVQKWNEQASIWRDRRLHTQANYSSFLTLIYQKARKSIFSTSIPRYLPAWDTPWGNEVLRAQRDNFFAKSTRVFIFESREDLTEPAIKVMKFHRNQKVEVWVHFAGNKLDSIFPEEHGPDWTLVDDGEVVGITRQFGDTYEADWYFNYAEYHPRFCNYRKNLLSMSERFDL